MTNNKKKNIVTAAQKLFVDQGIEKTTSRQIAEAAEVNLGLIHYYFQSKKQIAITILKRLFELFSELAEEQVSPVDDPLAYQLLIMKMYLYFLSSGHNAEFFYDLMSDDIMDEVFSDTSQTNLLNVRDHYNIDKSSEDVLIIQFITISSLRTMILKNKNRLISKSISEISDIETEMLMYQLDIKPEEKQRVINQVNTVLPELLDKNHKYFNLKEIDLF